MMRLRIRRPPRVDLALGRDRIWAIPPAGSRDPDGQDLWSRDLEPTPAGGWADLTDRLTRMREEMGAGAGRLRVALLPPLIRVRRVELPRLPDDSLRSVLVRDASRYFPGASGPQVIGIRKLSAGRRSPATYLVTAADASVVESIFDSTAAAGWTVESVVSAYTVWEAAARRLWPELTHQAGQVTVSRGDRVEVLELERGRLALVRRFSSSAPWSEAKEAGHSRVLECPETTAARATASAAEPDLLPDRVREERRQRAGRLSARLLAGAAALLLLTAALEAWGAARELARVESRRAALKPNVAKAMQLRDQMGQLDTRLRLLAGAEAGRSQWARTLVSVAEFLPSDAHLVGFSGSADSVVLEGEARQAGIVFESLQKAPGIMSVRADAPIRQEARDSGPAVERFTLAARLAPR